MQKFSILFLLSFVLVSALFIVSPEPAHAATITAPTCNQTDVQNAINAAVDGDTVMIPAGMCNWVSTLTINKAITLQGAGIGNTIIRDSHPSDTVILTWTLVAIALSKQNA